MKALCRAWEDEWQGMVMGELRYSKGEGETDGPCEISWSGRKIIRIRAVKGTGRMEILLFLSPEKRWGRKGRIRESGGTLFLKRRYVPSAWPWGITMKSISPTVLW